MLSLKNTQYNLITGIVVQGKQLGRTIGFPTANINPSKIMNASLRKGVYGVYVYYGNEQYIGVMNVGERPSFDDGNHLTYEVHILDFNDNLYGRELIVETAIFIREEQRFPSLSDLIQQLHKDVHYATSRLEKEILAIGGLPHAQ